MQHSHPRMLATAAATATALLLSACGSSEEDVAAPPTAEDVAASANTVEVPDWTGGSLYDAIVDIRELKFNYTVLRDGEAAAPEEIENTRKFEVVEQAPEAGASVPPLTEVELTVVPEDQG